MTAAAMSSASATESQVWTIPVSVASYVNGNFVERYDTLFDQKEGKVRYHHMTS